MASVYFCIKGNDLRMDCSGISSAKAIGAIEEELVMTSLSSGGLEMRAAISLVGRHSRADEGSAALKWLNNRFTLIYIPA
ncbi:hypothetical protein D3C75_1143470 [compost metagenome]